MESIYPMLLNFITVFFIAIIMFMLKDIKQQLRDSAISINVINVRLEREASNIEHFKQSTKEMQCRIFWA